MGMDSAFRQTLRAQAHHLNAIILIGQQGLTPALIKELDRALNAHELVKIKWKDSDKSRREEAIDHLTQLLSAESVSHIGKHFVLWRPRPESEAHQTADRQASALPKKPAAKTGVKKTASKTCAKPKACAAKTFYRQTPAKG